MGDTIATLGIKIDSKDIKVLNKELEKVVSTAVSVEKATDKIGTSLSKLTVESKKNAESESKRTAAINEITRALAIQQIKTKDGIEGITKYNLALLGASDAQKKMASDIISGTEAIKRSRSEEALQVKNNLAAFKFAMSEKATASKKAEDAEKSRASSINTIISALAKEEQALSMSKDDLIKYNLALLGASESEKKAAQEIINRISAVKAAQKAEQENSKILKEKAIIQAESVKSEQKRKESINDIILKLRDEAATTGKSKAELTAYRLSLLGASDAEKKEAQELIKRTQALHDANSATNKHGDALKSLISRLSALGAAYFGFQALNGFASDLLETAKTADSYKFSLQAVSNSNEEAAETFEYLTKESERLGLSLVSQEKAFTGFAAAAKQSGMKVEETRSVYTGLMEAMTAMHRSPEEAAQALKAFQDMLSKGTIQAEELKKQLGNSLPGAMAYMADATGKTTKDLMKMMEKGILPAKEGVMILSDYLSNKFQVAAENASNSVQSSINKMEKAWFFLKKAIVDAMGDNTTGIIKNVTESIKELTKSLSDPSIQQDIKEIGNALLVVANFAKDATIGISKMITSVKDFDPLDPAGIGLWAKTYAVGIAMVKDGMIDAAEFDKASAKERDLLIKKAIKDQEEYKYSLIDSAKHSQTASEQATEGIKRITDAQVQANKETFLGAGVSAEQAKQIEKITEKIKEKASEAGKTAIQIQADQLRELGMSEPLVQAQIKIMEATEAKNNAVKDGIKASKEAEAQENKRVKFIEDYIAKLEQEADTYKKGKEYTADYILGLKDATEAQKQRAKAAGAFIDAAKRQDEAEKKNKKNLEDYAALMKKVMPEFERDELSRQQALELTATIFKDKLTPAMMGTAAALHLFDEQSEAIKNINEYFDTKEIDDFTKKTDELKDKLKFEGTSFGNEIADGINNAVISMQKFNDQLDKQTKYQKDIDKLQKEIDTTSNLDLKAKKQKEMDDLAQEGIKGQLSAYRQLFGTTSQLFKENSKERKALHNLEMAFAMAEIAMNLQKTISAAYTAIMIQGTGDPYSAFGRIAAMTALAGGIVAAAGGSLSGGGSGSAPTAVSGASQSTALGSTEQSQSIANAFSFLEDIESGQYNELKDISSSMKDLNKNITGLVTSIVRTGGISEFEGVAGKTTTTGSNILKYGAGTPFLSPIAVNDLIQGVKSGISKPIEDALTAISPFTLGASGLISDLLSSATSAIYGGSKKTSVLASGLQITPGTIESGQYSTQAYADIVIKKDGGLWGSDKKYPKTLTDEVDQSVQDMVSLVFKNMGETMVDIAKGLGFGDEKLNEVLNYVFKIDKIDLKGLDTEGINKKLQEAFSETSDIAVTELFGELIGRYQKIGEGILETAVRLVGEKAVIMDVLELTNQGFDGSDIPAKALEVTQALIDMAGGLDNLTDAAATYYDKFFSDAEKQTRLQDQLTESFSSLNLELPKTREGYRAIIEGLDLTTEAGQKTYVSLLGLSEGADKYYTSLENGNKVLAENQKNILSINSGLEKSIAQMDMSPFEKSIDDVNISTANTIKTLKDYGATEDQLANARLYGQKQIESLTKAEEKRIEDLEKANKRLYDNKMVELLDAEGKSTEALILKRQLELDNMDESLIPMQKRIYELQDEKKALELSIKANKEFTESILANIQAQEDARKSQEDRVNNSSYELYLELLREEGKISSAQNLERKARLNELNHIALEDMQKEIWVRQDKRAIDTMMVDLLNLEGKTIESVALSRKLELDTLTDAQKVIQSRIWQLQDEAKIKELSNNITAKTIEILKLQGKEEEALAIQRQMELAALDPALRGLQQTIYDLTDAANVSAQEMQNASQRIETNEKLLQRLYSLQGKDEEVLRMQRNAEIEALGLSHLPILKRIYQLEDEKKATEAATAALEKANTERKALLEQQLSDAEDALRKSIDNQISLYQEMADKASKILEESRSLLDRSFENEKEKITKRHEELIAGLTLRLDEAQIAASDLENVFNSLSDARKSMEGVSGGLTYKAVQKQLVDAITMAKTGNISGAKELVPNLGILTSQGAENYSSQQDFKRDFFKTYNSLSELEKLTGQQLTDQQQIVKNLKNQIALENTNHAASMAALQTQYDAVIGVNNSVISFQEAITQYQKAQYEADGANTLLKTQTEILNNQLSTLLGIDNGILSVEAAINNLIAAQAALSSISQANIPAFASGGIHYGGLRIVGENGPEMEYTPPANITSNNDLKSMISNEEVVAELKAMRTEMARANFEIVKNTADSSKTLKKFDYDGMPETRTA